MKLDSAGDLAWTRSYPQGSYSSGASVRQATDGGYVVVGSSSDSSAAASRLLLIRTGDDGDTVWTATFGFSQPVEGYCIEQSPSGDFVVAARSGIPQRAQSRFGLLFLAGINIQGAMLWNRAIPLYVFNTDSLGINDPYMSRKGEGGEMIISGASGPDLTMPFLMRVGNDGTIEWQKMLGGLIYSMSAATSFRQLSDGGTIVTGTKMGRLLLTRVSRPSGTSAVEPERELPGQMDLSQYPVRHGHPVMQSTQGQ